MQIRTLKQDTPSTGTQRKANVTEPTRERLLKSFLTESNLFLLSIQGNRNYPLQPALHFSILLVSWVGHVSVVHIPSGSAALQEQLFWNLLHLALFSIGPWFYEYPSSASVKGESHYKVPSPSPTNQSQVLFQATRIVATIKKIQPWWKRWKRIQNALLSRPIRCRALCACLGGGPLKKEGLLI